MTTQEPKRLRALLVTSRVTFVPGNYDGLICGAAACPQICGLLVLENRTTDLLIKAAGLLALGARRTGMSLLKSFFGYSAKRREEAFGAAGKGCWMLPTVNCDEAVDLIRSQNVDLIVNARTRCIYKNRILTAPRLGCINIHHGLLPEQRGTMCDLWALSEGRPAGFSIHVMTSKVDAGGILRRVETSNGEDRDYGAYLRRSTLRERDALLEVLKEIEESSAVSAVPNAVSSQTVYRKNPTPDEMRSMLRQGMIL